MTFTPRTSGTPSFQRYLVSTPGGNRVPLCVRGAGGGPGVALSARALDFGSVRLGQAASKVVYLENTSEVAAAYEIRDEGGGVFELSRPRGVVPPKSVAHTRVAFAPGTAANFWRRLVCIVKVREGLVVAATRGCVQNLCHELGTQQGARFNACRGTRPLP